MERSRRSFLKIAGISALGIGVKPVLDVIAEQHDEAVEPIVKKHDNALTAKRWGMVIDTHKLQSEELFGKIINACHHTHNVPEFKNKLHEIKWIWLEEFQHTFPSIDAEYISDHARSSHFLTLCNHCENPPCVRACPTKATFKRPDGIVMMDFHRCIGCRFCMAACPYGSRSFNFRDPRPFIKEQNPKFPTRMKGVVEKCNFCEERLAEGKPPACVEVSEGALVFGDLDDSDSEIRQVLKENYTIRRKPELGAGPNIFYIV